MIPANNDKKAYNYELRRARRATAKAVALRAAIVKANPKFKGPSTAGLEAALKALLAAKRFKV